MDIELLSKMVKELILDDDKVVLPGLGSFVAEIVPATFSDKGYTINPPYRRLYFRSRPDEGDALIDFYARSNSVERDVAERIIKDFVAELKDVLCLKKTVIFPGLGRLRATKENNIFFVADETLDIYPAGFGLEPISLKTHQETTEEVSAAVEGLKSLLSEPAVQSVAVQDDEPAKDDKPAEDVEPMPEPENEPEIPEPENMQVQPEEIPDGDDQEQADVPSHSEFPEHLENQDKSTAGKILLKVFLATVISALVLLAAYAAIGRLCPELVDRYLYSPEEREILNHR